MVNGDGGSNIYSDRSSSSDNSSGSEYGICPIAPVFIKFWLPPPEKADEVELSLLELP